LAQEETIVNRVLRFALALALLGAANSAFASVSISSPTTGEVWVAGTFNKNVTFTYTNGCSGGKAEIYVQGMSVFPDWWNNFGALSTNPTTLTVSVVPQPGQPGTDTNMICEVNITHTNGTHSMDQVLFKIRN
jgi:hypothetical protein